MKLLPLGRKNKIYNVLTRFRGAPTAWFVFGSYLLGMASLFVLPRRAAGPKADQQNIVLQADVSHLLNTYHLMQSMDVVVKASATNAPYSIDPAEAAQKNQNLKSAFEAEAEATGMAIAFARDISPTQRYELYHDLNEIKPKPGYFADTPAADPGFLLFSRAQSQVLDRKGAQQNLAAAREIISAPEHGWEVIFGMALLPAVFGTAAAYGLDVTRKRLYKSIDREEEAIRRADEERRKAEAQRQAEETSRLAAEEAKRLAAEEAERQRIASLPPSTTLERDIHVSKIKLSKPQIQGATV